MSNGGFREILGGYRNHAGSDAGEPRIVNHAAQVNFVGCCHTGSVLRQAIMELHGSTITTPTNEMWAWLAQPPRPRRRSRRRHGRG